MIDVASSLLCLRAMVHTVVVVDDDPDILDFLQLLLSMHGMYVVTSDHTGDVAALIRQAAPDVVLLDLQALQDRQSGLRILVQLRADAATAHVPVILMSCDDAALARHVAHFHELEALPLVKPFDPNRLLQMIEQLAA